MTIKQFLTRIIVEVIMAAKKNFLSESRSQTIVVRCGTDWDDTAWATEQMYIWWWILGVFIRRRSSIHSSRLSSIQNSGSSNIRTTTRVKRKDEHWRLKFAAEDADRFSLSYLDVIWLVKYQLLKAHDFLAAPIRRWSNPNPLVPRTHRAGGYLKSEFLATYKRYRKLFDLKKFIIFFLIFSLSSVPWNSEPYLSNFHFCRAHFCQSSKDESCSNSLSAISLLFLV